MEWPTYLIGFQKSVDRSEDFVPFKDKKSDGDALDLTWFLISWTIWDNLLNYNQGNLKKAKKSLTVIESILPIS